ncbi:hypothetical protein BV341_05746 [Pseudomonas syringae pv. actinidiae]|nr:hypothetical protein BV341_05746 [Pseudomonas syringae pv. actinidiae]
MENLGAFLVGDLVHGTLEGGAAGLEGARRDVVLEELLVDDVDYGGDQGLDVLGTGGESFDVIGAEIKEGMEIADARLETGVELLAVDVLHRGSGSRRARAG